MSIRGSRIMNNVRRSSNRAVLTLLASVAALSSAQASAQASKYFARQHLTMERTAAPTDKPDEPYPTNGTPKDQVEWVDRAVSQISIAGGRFSKLNGRPPASLDELNSQFPVNIGIIGSPVLSISLSRDWRWSPRWNTPEENSVTYIAITLNDNPDAFCREWSSSHTSDPSILIGQGLCSGYYGYHITRHL